MMFRTTALRLGVASGLAALLLVGGALLAASMTRSGDAAQPVAAATSPLPSPRNPKDEAAAKTTPQPPRPTPRPWVAQSAADVLRNLPSDPNFGSAISSLTSGIEADRRAVGRTPTLGAPLFVRALRPGDPNEFLVPVEVGSTTIAIIKVGLDANGFGQLHAVRGWSSGPTFPSTSSVDALALASVPGDGTTRAELVWATVRGLAEELRPFWRVTRASGAVYYVFEDGTVADASRMQIE
jgi:hypothetical protein